MPLTPAEQAELASIYSQLAEMDLQEQGQKHLDAMEAARRPKPAKRPFSLFRATVGAVRDAGQGIIETAETLGDKLQRALPLPGVALGGDASNGIIGIIPADEMTRRTALHNLPILPDFKGSENAGTAEKTVRNIGSFLVPFVGFSRTLGLARAESILGRVSIGAAAGAATDFTQLDPVAGNMANVLKETFGISNSTLDALASDDDDDDLDARFKAAVSGSIIGVGTDAVLEMGSKALRAYKAWRGTLDEASAAVEATKQKMGVEWKPLEPKKAAAKEADEVASAASIDPMSVSRKEPIESPEDILDFLKRKTTEGATEEDVAELASKLVHGNPDNALSKLGIDPAKLDYSKFDDPAQLQRFHEELRDVFEGIANRLGRTSRRVTEKEIHLAARSMATTADALKDLFGNTSNLAETLMASRMIVGSHAHKLLALADAATKALKAGGGEEEWKAFLEAFYRHAYFLGALRGAGSEVGRALKSLQMVARVGKSRASGVAEDALRKEAGQQVADPRAIAGEAADAVGQMTENTEKLLLLGRIIDKDGDVGDLSRFVRAKSGSTLKRLDSALGETRGNLFSSSTAALNILSGTAMMGMRTISKYMAAVGRMTLSPFGKNHSLAARRNLMEAWAYTDGMISGWRMALQNTVGVLEREGMSEVAINLDGLGLKKLASQAAGVATAGSKKIAGENFERVDIVSHDRAFAMTAADRRLLYSKIEGWDTPQLMEHSLKFLTRTLGAATNAAGTLSRLGTILFINAPDQFIGTMAAKAGAQAQAVRLAAREAAEMQLEGKELSEFLRARTVQLTETVDGFSDDAYNAGQRETALAHGDAEGHEILFQDDLEFGFTRGISRMAGGIPFFNMIVPFVKTPLRILERTALDYTPVGLLKDRVRRAIMAGGPEGDEALARLGLGMMMTTTAFMLAEDRNIIGSDGSFKSSARLARPSYSFKIGDDVIEVNRIDPLGTLIGWAADVRAYLDQEENDPDANGKASQMFEAAMWATTANILSKTWLQSLQNLTELAGVDSDEELSTRWRNYSKSFAARVVPASGIQRSVTKGIDGFTREAMNFSDAILAASFGADKLPPKRDQLLGRPLPVQASDRLFGVKASPGADVEDPVVEELDHLSYDLPRAKRTILGVKLNATQYSRWLELKGQIVRNPKTGLTLEESLGELFKLPEYQSLPRMGRIEAIREETKGFSKLATDALLQEDKAFAHEAIRKETAATLMKQQGDLGQLDAETERFAQELGLTE